MNKKVKRPKTAFSLIELSIVILIISMIVSSALTVSRTSMKNANIKITKERMDVIYKALTNYLSVNKRLPCPALITLPNTDASYGVESQSESPCSKVNIGSQLYYGMIPTTTLGLPAEMASDGFGTKFGYVVHSNFTTQSTEVSSTNGFEGTRTAQYAGSNIVPQTIINITSNGTPIVSSATGWAIFALISHGPNKLGGYNASGTRQNTLPIAATAADELSNVRNDNISNIFDNTFVVNSTNPTFDDIVMYKTKANMVMDAGLEYTICLQDKMKIGTEEYTWNASYYSNTPVKSTTTCETAKGTDKYYSRLCGKYGVWSAPGACI